MLPIIFRIGSFTFYTYGVFLALAFFWFLYVAWKLLRITPHKEEELFDKIFLSLGIGLLAGRIAYILPNFDIIIKKGFLAFLAVHLYPGFHGFTVVFASLFALMFLARGKKYTGAEIAAHIIPAICVAMAIINVGAIFSGGVVGMPTDFPIRIKYALYDGLRHVPTLYRALAFGVMAFVFYRLLFMTRQGKLKHEIIIGSFLWLFALTSMLTIPIHDSLTYGKNNIYRLYDMYSSVFILLTSFGYLVYHWRSYFYGFIKFAPKASNKNG
ncbi:MAG: prolipoprotein diacylglyceryl transferase family protein [Patescibacteria group bacterium]